MATREEINKTRHLFLRNAYEAGRNGRPLKEDEKVKGFLGALSLQDVVLKVERELPIPKWEEVEGTAIEVDCDTWAKMLAMLAAILDRATKAGYSATEPLIKEG